MVTQIVEQPARDIIYPDSDGQPMADNTKQFRYIVMIQGGIDALFRDDPRVFVAGDLLWYPVEGRPDICAAPDTLVVFGRPKGDRGSYRQWEEDDLPPQVVFEVLSPRNTNREMIRKYKFYEQYGVDEYYLYDPDSGELSGWTRQVDELQPIAEMEGWVSPRLGIRFTLEGLELALYRPDGERFATYLELVEQRAAAEARASTAETRASTAETRASTAEARAEALAARLRALGIDPDGEQV
ncbi:MAG: Uma2 family endonuclease [Chloroflexaceae bacterium]|nr:Uma2 family endonuclease [Chloroflexaceae bacterium]